MKKKTIICSVVVLVLSMLIASMAMAIECPPGQVGMTIVPGNSGRIMEICVGENAADHISVPGAVVIPATCPCFAQEELLEAVSEEPDACGVWAMGITEDGEPCGTGFINATDDKEQFLVQNVKSGKCNVQERYYYNVLSMCLLAVCPIIKPVEFTVCGCYSEDSEISTEEWQACMAIMKKTINWVSY